MEDRVSGRLVWVAACLLCAGGCVRIHMPGKSFSGPLPPMTAQQSDLSARLRGHVQVLGGDIGERNVFTPEKLEQAAKYVESAFEKLGYETGRQEYDVSAGGAGRVRNIDVNVPGTTRADQIIVVGAHYDSVRGAPGANDNASGVAAVLEIARMLKDAKLPRTIRYVAFVNEEPPFFQTDDMGSVVYAKRCKERAERIVAMLTPETIGCYSDEKGSQNYPSIMGLFYPKVGNFITFVGESGSGDLVSHCVGLFRQFAQFPSEGGAAPASMEGIGWSDHWSFSRQGYKAVMITDTAPFRYRYYHTAEDTPDKCDYDRMARVVEGLARVVQHLASEERG
jgi:Zn-dependent M28 family amino/carboxypeptidase